MASARPSCAPWNEDAPADLPIIEDRLDRLILRMAAAAPGRAAPTVAMACEWHREVHQGLHIPVPYYAGEIRDADPRFPCLIGYELRVGILHGTPSANVPAGLDFFERAMQQATANLDAPFPTDYVPTDIDELREVIALCAIAHGEWVRIHPFANGNGRTARLWADWCALRYGLPPFVRLRPRPAHSDYGQAAAASMRGDHQPMENVFLEMLLNLPS